MSEKVIEHPMEEIFDLEPGTTLMDVTTVEPTEIATVQHEDYDNKDNEVEQQFEQIYKTAMTAFEDQFGIAESVEGKFAARNAEVAAVFLNTALSAVKEKSALKQHKDNVKVKQAKATTPTTQNNNLIIDRNQLIKMLASDD